MAELETIRQTYLFKLRQSPGVKCLIERHWSRADWKDIGEGYHAVEAELALSGWSRARRVVVVRRAVKDTLVAETKKTGKRQKRQQRLQFADPSQPVKLWEYAVLVTNADYDLDAIGQLYRDRADCENCFDELKNQWGWGGYARSQEFRLRSSEVQLQGDIAAARASLAEASGRTDFRPHESAIAVPAWQNVAAEEALSVKLARTRETVAAAAERQARANLLPRLMADAGYSATRATGAAAGNGSRDDWGVGLTLSWPLGVSAFRQEDAARAGRLAAIDVTRASFRETESAIVALRAQYDAALAEVAAMEKEARYRASALIKTDPRIAQGIDPVS